MHKTLKDFVGATHVDEIDKLAQRALKALGQCGGPSGLIANAYNRGDEEAYTEVSRAHYEASIAFVLINKHKAYPFAEEVLAGLAVQDVQTSMAGAAAAFYTGSAEAIVEAFAERCRPVCQIVGDVGVVILRGAHAAAAMKDVVPANAA